KTRRGIEFSKEQASGLVTHLISHYPAHEFVISRNEARDLGLPVEKLEAYPRKQALKTIYDDFIESEETDIRVLDDLALSRFEVEPPVTPPKEKSYETIIQYSHEEDGQEKRQGQNGDSAPEALTTRAGTEV